MMLQTSVNPRASQAYQRCQIQSDDPMGLVLRLYDGLIAFLRVGSEKLEKGEYSDAALIIGRALDVVAYLQNTLDLEKGEEAAASLDRLYDVLRLRISSAHLKRDGAALLEVVGLVEPVRDAWASVRSGVAEGA